MVFELCKSMTIEEARKLPLDKYYIQLKRDGSREKLVFKGGKLVGMLNRRNFNRIDRFSHLKDIRFKDVDDMIIDGELVYIKSWKSDKEDFQGLLKSENWNKAVFIAFDLTRKDGKDLTLLPYRTRYAMLSDLYTFNMRHNTLFRIAKNLDINRLWSKVIDEDREGIVLKPKDSKYYGSRTNWIKVKVKKQTDITFTSYTRHNKGITLQSEEGIRVACNGKQSIEVAEKCDRNGFVVGEVNYMRRNPSGKLYQPIWSKLK